MIVAHAIESAIAEGAVEVDFLRGAEPHKRRWGAVEVPGYRRVLRRPVI